MFGSIKKEIKQIRGVLDEMQILIDKMKRDHEEYQRVISNRHARVPLRLYTISYEDGELKRTFI